MKSELLFLIILVSISSLGNTRSIKPIGQVTTKKVFFDNDANVDDFIASIVMLSLKNVDIIGVGITQADCILEAGIEGNLKLFSTFKKNIPLSVGVAQGKNLFPENYKMTGLKAVVLPQMLNQKAENSLVVSEPTHDFMAKKILSSKEKVSVLLVGPPSNFVLALEKHPEIKNNIEEVVFMGGAVYVEGNVFSQPSAEWNMFWDPESTKKLLQSGLKLVMFPLDVTNKLPVDRNFLKEFAGQSNFPVSNLFSQMFAVSYFEDPQHFHDYFLWDVTAAGYFGAKDLFKYKKLEIDVITEGQDQGKTILKPGSGQWVIVALDIERDNFISFLKNLLRK